MLPFVQDGTNPTVEALMQHLPSKRIELVPGDLLLRDPGMWHRGNPNPTDEPRTMLTTSYFRRSFFYDYGDPLHNLDDELFAALDPSIKPLFAYAFDKTNPFHQKLRRARALRAIKTRRLLAHRCASENAGTSECAMRRAGSADGSCIRDVIACCSGRANDRYA